LGQISLSRPSKLIIGFIYRDILTKNAALSFLKKRFGKIDFQSPELDFNYTDYYFPELGAPLKRAFISFAQLKQEDELAGIKLHTNKLEEHFQLKGGSTTPIRLTSSFDKLRTNTERSRMCSFVQGCPERSRRTLTTGKRRINIDPGFLSLGKLILATTKDQCHRVYLGRGIFAEVTLFYKRKTFNPWPWTYLDYKSQEYIDIFNSIRAIYQKQIRYHLPTPPRYNKLLLGGK